MKPRALLSVAKRELHSVFISPIAYIVITLYLAVTGWFFFSTFFLNGQADMRRFFSLLPMVMALTIPAITMRVFAEEYKSGSFEILKTLPLTTLDIVLGKFLATLLFIVIMLLPTLSYPLFIQALGDLDPGPVAGGYIGALFLIAAYTGIGLLLSSLSSNQITAFITSTVLCLGLSLLHNTAFLFPPAPAAVLEQLSSGYHFNAIAKGLLDLRDILYFSGLTFITLYTAWTLNRRGKPRKTKGFLYTLVTILLFIALQPYTFRLDLTDTKRYSLSGLSRGIVAGLEEPLTVKAYLSEDLPAPYSRLNQEITDILSEYARFSGQNFNYTIKQVPSGGESESPEAAEIRREAESYGIRPVNIQRVESDQVNLASAYMGMVFIQGDIIEPLPVLAAGQNLEYLLTSRIESLQEKTGALLALSDPLELTLYLSPSLFSLSDSLKAYPEAVSRAVDELNRKYYGKLTYRQKDPGASAGFASRAADWGLPTLAVNGPGASQQEAWAAMVLVSGNERAVVPLVTRGMMGYTLRDPAQLSDTIEGMVESVVGTGRRIGYLADHDTIPLTPAANRSGGSPRASIQTLQDVLGERYTIAPVTLEEGIPEDLRSLLILQPNRPFSDWELFQIDQFLMRGGDLAIFSDAFQEVMINPDQGPYGGRPYYIPRQTGLERLWESYGVTREGAYVMDTRCYLQRGRGADGSLQEIPFYFAPELDRQGLNENLPYLRGIKGLITLNNSPITIPEESPAGVSITPILSSSPDSWTESENLDLYDPRRYFPPPRDERRSYPLAVEISGTLKSLFAGEAPPQPAPGVPPEESAAGSGGISDTAVSTTLHPLEQTDRGRLYLFGSAMVLSDNLLDPSGEGPNTAFALNLLDVMNDRGDYAVMRAKGLFYNPLKEVSPRAKRFVKGFNMIVLPLMAALTGLAVYGASLRKRRRIEELYREDYQ